mmetsp:Transcript_4356/g.7693  ORF Transcript_4356/g.7693 Transcript_4356/m.7693 type:complete len:1248 (+) Transcript_4356:95-3838(+)
MNVRLWFFMPVWHFCFLPCLASNWIRKQILVESDGRPKPSVVLFKTSQDEKAYCDDSGCWTTDRSGKRCKDANPSAKQITCPPRVSPDVWLSDQPVLSEVKSHAEPSLNPPKRSMSMVEEQAERISRPGPKLVHAAHLAYCDDSGCATSDPEGLFCKLQTPSSTSVKCLEVDAASFAEAPKLPELPDGVEIKVWDRSGTGQTGQPVQGQPLPQHSYCDTMGCSSTDATGAYCRHVHPDASQTECPPYSRTLQTSVAISYCDDYGCATSDSTGLFCKTTNSAAKQIACPGLLRSQTTATTTETSGHSLQKAPDDSLEHAQELQLVLKRALDILEDDSLQHELENVIQQSLEVAVTAGTPYDTLQIKLEIVIQRALDVVDASDDSLKRALQTAIDRVLKFARAAEASQKHALELGIHEALGFLAANSKKHASEDVTEQSPKVVEAPDTELKRELEHFAERSPRTVKAPCGKMKHAPQKRSPEVAEVPDDSLNKALEHIMERSLKAIVSSSTSTTALPTTLSTTTSPRPCATAAATTSSSSTDDTTTEDTMTSATNPTAAASPPSIETTAIPKAEHSAATPNPCSKLTGATIFPNPSSATAATTTRATVTTTTAPCSNATATTTTRATITTTTTPCAATPTASSEVSPQAFSSDGAFEPCSMAPKIAALPPAATVEDSHLPEPWLDREKDSKPEREDSHLPDKTGENRHSLESKMSRSRLLDDMTPESEEEDAQSPYGIDLHPPPAQLSSPSKVMPFTRAATSTSTTTSIAPKSTTTSITSTSTTTSIAPTSTTTSIETTRKEDTFKSINGSIDGNNGSVQIRPCRKRAEVYAATTTTVGPTSEQRRPCRSSNGTTLWMHASKKAEASAKLNLTVSDGHCLRSLIEKLGDATFNLPRDTKHYLYTLISLLVEVLVNAVLYPPTEIEPPPHELAEIFDNSTLDMTTGAQNYLNNLTELLNDCTLPTGSQQYLKKLMETLIGVLKNAVLNLPTGPQIYLDSLMKNLENAILRLQIGAQIVDILATARLENGTLTDSENLLHSLAETFENATLNLPTDTQDSLCKLATILIEALADAVFHLPSVEKDLHDLTSISEGTKSIGTTTSLSIIFDSMSENTTETATPGGSKESGDDDEKGSVFGVVQAKVEAEAERHRPCRQQTLEDAVEATAKAEEDEKEREEFSEKIKQLEHEYEEKVQQLKDEEARRRPGNKPNSQKLKQGEQEEPPRVMIGKTKTTTIKPCHHAANGASQDP